MSIKIFLPANYFYLKHSCPLYGQVDISDDNVVVYYIVANSNKLNTKESCELRFLGAVCNYNDLASSQQYKQDMVICFGFNDDSPNLNIIYLGIMPENIKQIKLFLYNKHVMGNLFIKTGTESPSSCIDRNSNRSDFHTLFRLIQAPNAIQRSTKTNILRQTLFAMANIPASAFHCLIENRFMRSIMMHTVIYKHNEYCKITSPNSCRISNIILDRVLGLILMLVLCLAISHPGDYLIHISHGIITYLYSLLKVLEGSPIGLKLNIHLNNFFLDCFRYHIELWSTFLDLIEPAVRQLFLGIAALGSLGFTYQLALLADLITIVGLHAHCFYVYTKVLYNVEIKGLQVLWQVVRGKRFNILKGRIELHNYMNRQLYLATIFFSAILFLFPTTFVYYVVFASLKSLTWITNYLLERVRHQLLNFPIENCLKLLTHKYFESESFKIQDLSIHQNLYLRHKNANISVHVFEITI